MEITKKYISDWLQQLQTTICKALEEADVSKKFKIIMYSQFSQYTILLSFMGVTTRVALFVTIFFKAKKALKKYFHCHR